MFWRLVGITFVVVLSLLSTQLDAYITRSTGCYHNGTWYADKSVIPTMEKCLNCQCSKKTLVCRLKVCPEMPMPPPRGCVVVQKKNTCCPYLSCARLEAFYKIPMTRRIIAYLDHYERESIDRVVNDNMLQRRSDDSDVDLHVCVKNGTVYKSGSAMSSSNLCSYCYCIGGNEKCVKPKCMLPVEGCKPIFVDSTCCPVRYDCSTKTSGKSSQEVRYRKTANKHFMRMSQRLQRNRGCTVGSSYYAEGQKMKSDADKPCDICFCIRGSRRCAPKKCAPALKNCIPVVPKGHCCPSSYDCGSQRDYRRAQNSRQFNLYSLFFGKDEDSEKNTEIPVLYPHDRHPEVTDLNINKHPQQALMASSEKSIFDTLREGLEFIDANNKQLLVENEDLVGLASTAEQSVIETSTVSTPVNSPTTEISFLDLLLGSSEASAEAASKQANESEDSTEELESSSTGTSLSWVDLLLGPDEDDEKPQQQTIPAATITTSTESSSTPSIERIDNDLEDDFLSSGELSVGELPAEAQQQLLSSNELNPLAAASKTTQYEQKLAANLKENSQEQTLSTPATHSQPTSQPKPTQNTTIKVKSTTTAKPKVKAEASTIMSTLPTSTITTAKTTATPTKPTTAGPEKTQQNGSVKEEPHSPSDDAASKPLNNDLLSALFDMLNIDTVSNNTAVSSTAANRTTIATTTTSTTITTTTPKPKPKPTPQFKPLPSGKPFVRINSKIANLTMQTPTTTTKMTQNSTSQPSLDDSLSVAATSTRKPTTKTTQKTTMKTTKTTTTTTTTTSKPRTTAQPKTTTTKQVTTSTTTSNPIVIKTNPTILEADPIDAEPTLPPSLPNLKIIPFLPTDAVQADRPNPLFDYYNSNSNNNANSNIENDANNSNNNNNQHGSISRIDFDLYDDANAYPSITESFPYYPDLEDGSKAAYIYKFNVEAPAAVAVSPAVATVDTLATNNGFVSYNDFAVDGLKKTGFSPPTKTEGGFVPKEPLIIDPNSDEALAKINAENNYHATQHIIDITTSEPQNMNSTRVIEFTTPDPFRDVLRTEPSPDLTFLIEQHEPLRETNHQAPAAPSIENSDKTETTYNFKNPNDGVAIYQPEIELNTTIPHKIVSIAMPTIKKNRIESFLDYLLSDEEAVYPTDEQQASTVPPFRTLPTTTTAPTTTTKPITTTLSTTTAEVVTTLRTTAKTTTTTQQRSTAKPTRANTKTNTTTAPARNKTKTKTTNRNATQAPKNTKRAKPNSQRRVASKPSTTSTTVSPTTTTTAATTTKQKLPNQSTTIATPMQTKTAKTTTATATATSTPMPTATTTTTANPYFMSPFDKLPFMDASYEVKHKPLKPQHLSANTNQLSLLHYRNSQGKQEDLAAEYDGSLASAIALTATTTTTTTKPQQQSQSAINSLIDPAGILKLAGCNIYGRMYRVGRIILELSSPCLECKCTDVGVKCNPLDC